MNYASAYQSQVVARQRMDEAASAAREHTRRHSMREAADRPRTPRFRVHWPHPARAGFQH